MKSFHLIIAIALSAALAGCLQHVPSAYVTQIAQTPGAHVPPPVSPSAVSAAGQVVGQDPDPHVRTELQRNAYCYRENCYQ